MDPALRLFFWLQVAVFALHILDETMARIRHIARLDLGVALALGALAWTIFSSAPPLLARFFLRGPVAA